MSVKTEKELQIMRENGKVHKEVFEQIKKMAKPWVNAMDIDRLCWDICAKYDVLCWFKWVYDFPRNIIICVNDCLVHGIPNNKIVFKDWDVVTFDFWVKDKKLWLNTDAAFTMIIWDWPHNLEVTRFLKVSEEALYKWLAKAIPWNKVWDISSAIQKHIESNWYHIVKDLTWHWVGYTLHEKPYIPNFWVAWKWEMLRENMTLAIEPIVWFSTWRIREKWFEIYTADWWLWAQFEHTIVVKNGYPEIIV